MLTDDGRTPATILEAWRSAERKLAGAAQGSPDYDALAARVLELARAYREASRDRGPTDPTTDPGRPGPAPSRG
jgi:hypothetical protein